MYLELLRRGYDVYIGKMGEYEVDFVAIDKNGKAYIQVCETLRSADQNSNATLERELLPLQKINDNYPKYILTSDKTPLGNEEGIIIQNVHE